MKAGDEVREVRVLRVLRLEVHRGRGVAEDPSRIVVQYWTVDETPDGAPASLIVERDAWAEREAAS